MEQGDEEKNEGKGSEYGRVERSVDGRESDGGED